MLTSDLTCTLEAVEQQTPYPSQYAHDYGPLWPKHVVKLYVNVDRVSI